MKGRGSWLRESDEEEKGCERAELKEEKECDMVWLEEEKGC